jgi:hypothetical protein
MMRTIPGYSARGHFSAFCNELSYGSGVFVIDFERFVGAETAHFAPEHGPAARPSFFVVTSFATRSAAWFSSCHMFNYLALGTLVEKLSYLVQAPIALT